MKTLDAPRAAVRQDRLAGADHVRRVDVVADHLQREIGLHRRRDVEGAAVIQRPAAVRALDAAQVEADLALQLRDRRARRDSGAAGRIRPGWWRRPRARTPSGRRRAAAASSASVARPIAGLDVSSGSVGRSSARSSARISSSLAAWRQAPRPSRPERSAPSMVAGRPVSVQSPARNRLRQRVAARGRLGDPARAWRRRWRASP